MHVTQGTDTAIQVQVDTGPKVVLKGIQLSKMTQLLSQSSTVLYIRSGRNRKPGYGPHLCIGESKLPNPKTQLDG